MGVEKESSKNGGYVGGFFQLFDWKAKSRKKLFSSKLDSPEQSKQGKRSDGNLPMTRFHLMDEDDIGLGPFPRGSSDYSCASSVTDEEGFGTKAPGVVARLMGLDSLPTPNFAEPNSTPFFDAQSLREASQRRKHVEYYHDDQIMYSGYLLNKEDSFSRNFGEPKPQKVISRPIEKFQTEVLPPKSAKSIPITHHKLLSPIKSHGFIPSKTAAHIMEAAAKIIEPSPQVAAKAKVPLVGSSSAPLKVRDLKEKLELVQRMPAVGSSSMPTKARDFKERPEPTHRTTRTAEASRKPSELNTYNVQTNSSKYLRGQPMNKSWNGSVNTTFQALPEREEGPSGSKSKGKSVSLAIQAKVNVQRREGLSSTSSQGFVGQKEKNEVTSIQSFKSQPNAQKSIHKNTANGSTVLRQNNQKQNCRREKDILPSKPTVSTLQGRKVASGGPVRYKTSEKNVESEIGSRKLSSEITNSKREISNNAVGNAPRKKRSIDDKLQSKRSQDIDSSRRAIESNPIVDRHFSLSQESKREGMDVVSFTFTSPLTRPLPGSDTSKSIGGCFENRGKRMLLDTNGMKLSSIGYNVIGGDNLSTLLEEKLKELTSHVGSSYYNSAKVGSTFDSMSILQNPVLNSNAGVSAPRLHDYNEHEMYVNKVGCSNSSNVISIDSSDVLSIGSANSSAFRLTEMIRGAGKMEDFSSPTNGLRKQLEHRRPSPVSVLETSDSTENSNSIDSTDSSYTEGSKPCSSIQGQEVLGSSSPKKFRYVDAEMELTDSASSMSTGIPSGEANTQTVTSTTLRSANWEIDYVKQVLSNFDWMFRDFALGRSHEIVNPHLFNQLENRKDIFESDAAETRQERKLLFDCVSECLEIRCTQYVGGGYRTWAKGMSIVRRRNQLAEEVHKEISMWRGMWECMVDELVDKDMSIQHGRWLDFEVDAYVLGTELEGHILNSLVDEVVSDILLC